MITFQDVISATVREGGWRGKVVSVSQCGWHQPHSRWEGGDSSRWQPDWHQHTEYQRGRDVGGGGDPGQSWPHGPTGVMSREPRSSHRYSVLTGLGLAPNLLFSCRRVCGLHVLVNTVHNTGIFTKFSRPRNLYLLHKEAILLKNRRETPYR